VEARIKHKATLEQSFKANNDLVAGRSSPPRDEVEDAAFTLKKKQREKHIKQIFDS
jgi:hypothetical protein